MNQPNINIIIKFLIGALGCYFIFKLCTVLYNMSQASIQESLYFLLGFIVGTCLHIGLTIIFWFAFKQRCTGNNYKVNILKAIIALLLYLIIISSFFNTSSFLEVFIITSLIIFLRKDYQSIFTN